MASTQRVAATSITPTNALETLNPSVAHLRIAEEVEREERLHGDNTQSLNAFKQAEMIKSAQFPVVGYNKGSWRHFNRREEQERRRLVSNKAELDAHTKLAASVASLVNNNKSFNTAIPMFKGTRRFTRSFEEHERARRIEDTFESSLRRANAHMLSDSMRVDGATARARLIRRRTPIPAQVLQQGKQQLRHTAPEPLATTAVAAAEQVKATAHTIAESLPTAQQVQHTASVIASAALDVAHDARDIAIDVAHDAREVARDVLPSADQMRVAADTAATVANAAAHKIGSLLPSYASLWGKATHLRDNISSAVSHAYYGDAELHVVDRATVRALEETERTRRVYADKNGRALLNARAASRLISAAPFPYVFAHARRGYRQYSAAVTESERTRRLANRDESSLRQANANRVAAKLTSLGWPFIRDAKNSNRTLSHTAAMEEEERASRTNADESIPRYNARRIAALVNDHSLQSNHEFICAYTRKLEKRERAYRATPMYTAAARTHARAESHLVEQIGYPFFVGASASHDRELLRHRLDAAAEDERQFRAAIARTREVAERRHMYDNSRKLASLLRPTPTRPAVHALPAAPANLSAVLLNKHERQLAFERQARKSDVINRDVSLLSEAERKSRLSDKYAQVVARDNAQRVSRMITQNLRTRALDTLPAVEPLRQSSTVIDIRLSQPAITAAPFFSSPALASIPVPPPMPTHAAPASRIPVPPPMPTRAAPASRIPVPPPMPTHAAPVSRIPVPPPMPTRAAPATRIPVPPPMPTRAAPATRTFTKKPLPAPPVPAKAAFVAPIVAPVAPATIAAPVAPIAVYTAPIVAPVYTAPIVAPVYTAPIVAPVYTTPVAPMVAPVYTAPVAPIAAPVAPIAAPIVAPVYTAPVAVISPPTATTTVTTTVLPTTTSTFATTQKVEPALIAKVQKMYAAELAAAERDNTKITGLSSRAKKGMFSEFRTQRHTHSATRHLANAKRHEDWLRAVNALPVAAPIVAGRPEF